MSEHPAALSEPPGMQTSGQDLPVHTIELQPRIDTPPAEPRDGVPPVITSVAQLSAYAQALSAGFGPVAIDAERASGYRYSQRAYLIQIRRNGAGSALIDPIACTDLSELAQAMQGTEWILHAATQDLACLAEVGLVPDRLFDTELAGRLLGKDKVNLGALVASELGHVLEKGHGAADWSLRPLTQLQLRYAVLDVEFLIELRQSLTQQLHDAGKWEWALQEFTALLSFRPRDRGEDAWRRTSGIHALKKPRQLAVARSLWFARDATARRSDIAPGRVLPDSAIVAAAVASPKNEDELSALPAFAGRGQQRRKHTWWSAIESAYALAEQELPARTVPATGPPPPKAWADKHPQAFARWEAGRTVSAELSQLHNLPVENLVSPDVMRKLCWDAPTTGEPAELAEYIHEQLLLAGARTWQADVLSEPIARAWNATTEVTDQ